MSDDLLTQWKLTNMLLAKIYGALISQNTGLDYALLEKEIKVINKMINVFCGDILDDK